MSEKRKLSTTKIPQVIDPGITIPIYDDDAERYQPITEQDQQSLGSYRSKAGKISNKFTSMLPSLTSKLHYSKKSSTEKLNEVSQIKPVDIKSHSIQMARPHISNNPSYTSDVPLSGSFTNSIWSNNDTVNTDINTKNKLSVTANSFNDVLFRTSSDYTDILESAQQMPSKDIWSPEAAVGRRRSQSMVTPSSFENQTLQLPIQIPHNQYPEIPLMVDDVDNATVSWVTTEQRGIPPINLISSLPPTNTLAISNIFSMQRLQQSLMNAINLTSVSLATLLSQFGTVISVRTISGLNIALVEFDSVESSTRALETLQEQDISMPGVPSKITYAQILPLHPNKLESISRAPSSEKVPLSLLQRQLFNGNITLQKQGNIQIPIFNSQPKLTNLFIPQQQQQQQQSQSSMAISSNDQDICPFPLPPKSFRELAPQISLVISNFNVSHDKEAAGHLVANALNTEPTTDITDFGPMPEELSTREFQTPKLREIRKALDNNKMDDVEIEQLAMALLDELPELSFDYLGNTIVQKIYDRSSPIIRDIILRKISPYLSSLGIHKSGTWVCQKVIKLAHNARALNLITCGIKMYCTALLNDQFGNYVIQEVLKFGSTWNGFIFETILANFWTVAHNRYGARAVRACLEANDVITPEHTLVVASVIVLYSEYLFTDNNGTLLITWLLDTCEFSEKYLNVTKHILPSITELCCHKLGSLTVLKILHSRGNEVPRKLILDAILEHDDLKNLEKILLDDNWGHIFMYKLLSSRLYEGEAKNYIVEKVRHVLLELKPAHPYHRLMEEVGLVSINTPNQQHSRNLSHQLNTPDRTRSMRGLSMSSAKTNNTLSNVVPITPIKQSESNVHNVNNFMSSPYFHGNNSTYSENVGVYSDENNNGSQQYRMELELRHMATSPSSNTMHHTLTTEATDSNASKYSMYGY